MNDSSSSERPVFSFVLPAYNEAANIADLAKRLVTVAEALGEPFEIVFVNDGSTDTTAGLLEALAEADPRFAPIHFSRNFGHMAALTAGLEAARATGAVVCMDADGQHPPELVPELVAHWRAGAEIVQTIRDATADTRAFKRLSAKLYYRALNVLGEVRIPEGAADFRLTDRHVVDVLNAVPERIRFIRGLVPWLGFETVFVHYEAPERLGGRTKYAFSAMVKLAVDGITSFSHRPLHLAFVLGTAVTLCAVAYAIVLLACFVLGIALVPGWAGTILVVLILSGIQLLTLGIACEYIARIYNEVKRRPLYVVKSRRRQPPAD